MIVSIIAAVGKKGVIGGKNQLPWRLPSDLKRFKGLTMGHPLIMGRKTLESMGRVLPGRKNIVLTSQEELKITGEDLYLVDSLEKAFKIAEDTNTPEVFVIGGESVFAEAMDKANKLYITKVDTDVDGDVYFPKIDDSVWKETKRELGNKTDQDEYPFEYIYYEKK